MNVTLRRQRQRVLPSFWKIGQAMRTGLGAHRLGSRLLSSVSDHVGILGEDT